MGHSPGKLQADDKIPTPDAQMPSEFEPVHVGQTEHMNATAMATPNQLHYYRQEYHLLGFAARMHASGWQL